MNWTQLLKSEAEDVYRATEGLMGLVDDKRLEWKPESGDNWMTTSGLLRHLTDACGWCCEQFVNDTWAAAMQGADPQPTTVSSVAEARRLLATDKARTFALIDRVGEKDLANRMVAAPWDPTKRPLGQQMLSMISHLAQHKGQLFYYLKLQGKPVNTYTLYGIPQPAAS